MKLSVRRVMPQDIGPMFLLAKRLWTERPVEHPKMDDEELDREMFWVMNNIQNPMNLFLIAYDGKKPIGYFTGYLQDHIYGKPRRTGVGMEIYVIPEKRGREVALRMMRMALDYAISQGAGTFEAGGIVGQTDKIWQKLGFKPYLVYSYMDTDAMRKTLGKMQRIIGGAQNVIEAETGS